MKSLVTLLILAVALVGGYFYFGRSTYTPTPGSSVTPESSPTPAPSVPAPSSQETSPAATPKEIRVAMSNLKFTPNTINLKAGEKVKLILSSKSSHTFTVDELNINWALSDGETMSYDLMVDQPGTYPIHCAVPGHKEGGMVGKLVVE